MFLQASVILLTGGVCLSACWDTPWSRPPSERTPPQNRHPPEQTSPPPSRADIPGADIPQEQTPPGAETPREVDSGIQSTSARYASYWNAFLFIFVVLWLQTIFSVYFPGLGDGWGPMILNSQVEFELFEVEQLSLSSWAFFRGYLGLGGSTNISSSDFGFTDYIPNNSGNV